MNNSEFVLTYAVRLPVIGKYTGQLLLVLILLTLPLLIVALFLGEYSTAIRYTEVIAALGLLSYWLSKISVPEQIQLNEALMITALTFVISPLLMSYPLQTVDMTFSDALFEAVSAITTTGLTTVTNLQNHSATFLFARSWMQWYGGLGIVVLSVSLYLGQYMIARQLTEPLNSEIMVTTARKYAQRMLAIYVLMTMVGLLILWLMIGDGFTALLYVFSAVSTGGFSPDDMSLAMFESQPIRLTISLLALCGAIPLPLYYLAWQKGLRDFYKDVEFIGLVLFTLITCLLLILHMHFNSGLSFHDSFYQGLLLGISAQTTSGFSSLPISELDNSEKLVTIFSMIVGGGVASTAGGFKVLNLNPV